MRITFKLHAFHFEMYKTVDTHSNLLVSWELMAEGYQGRPVKCAHFERPLQGMVILCFLVRKMSHCVGKKLPTKKVGKCLISYFLFRMVQKR